MKPAFAEQRNPYRGRTPRPWLCLRVLDASNSSIELTLIVDTGCPYAVIIDAQLLNQLARLPAPPVVSNFGAMTSAWVRLDMPDFGLQQDVLCHGSGTIGQAVSSDDSAFQGLVGLPILRLAEYGGNATEFWFRSLQPATTTP